MKKQFPPQIPYLEIFGWIQNLKAVRKRCSEIEEAQRQGWTVEQCAVKGMWGDMTSELKLGRKRINMAEEYLREHGWKMDKDGKVSRIRKDPPGRGRYLLGECVWEIYTAKYQEEYSKATDARKRTIRRRIAAELAPYQVFDPDELSPESDAPIYHFIEKGKKRKR